MIYLIKSGEYSNVAIHGYFTNEEDAYLYCELVRQKYLNGPDYPWRSNYYVEDVPEMQVEFPKERLKLICEYRFTFTRYSEAVGKWRFTEPYFRKPRDVYPQTDDHQPRIFHNRHTGVVETTETITVCADFCNYDRAKKIAQDYFAQLRAEGKIED